ncbi:PilZ domain-containing protein [Ligilactobacillus sp. Marseille-Q7487]|uniref:PilZ domain-containing protein n=1 Tax=Ligilactobacillus sp. Marseille-Q7487 TaxID=3022128 RepID=UPI0024A80284|nr:PilZ domain-containing protein [Ligilactobacillus sp. Marseille-Q7487]
MERPRYRKAERFVVQKKAKVQLDNQQLIEAFVVDLSEYGAHIKLINYSTKQQKLSGWLLIDDQKIAFETQRITITEQQKDVYIGCKFTTVTKQQYSYLITQTYAQKSTQIVQPIKKNRMFRVLFSWIIKHKKLRSVK